MSDKDIQNALAAHPFLLGLDQKYLLRIASVCERRLYKKDDYLMRFNQAANYFYLLEQGTVELINHVAGHFDDPLETISGNNVLGWSWLLEPYRWHFDVKAKTNLSGLLVHTEIFKAEMQTDPGFGAEMYKRFIKVIVERLQAARLQAMDIYAPPPGVLL